MSGGDLTDFSAFYVCSFLFLLVLVGRHFSARQCSAYIFGPGLGVFMIARNMSVGRIYDF